MRNSISEDTIEEVRQQNDIVDVIGETVQLKKNGQHRYIGLCPFHGENTPSFSVSQDRQLYYCFGCGAAGNVITFLMENEQLPFQEAVHSLAKRANIALELPQTPNESGKSGGQMFEAHALALRFYHHVFMHTEQGRQSYDYMKKRGVSEAALEHFQIGFAPPDRDPLVTLLKKRGFNLEEMAEAGLIQILDDGRAPYDRFRNRVVFPIWDLSGKPIAFGGRALEEETPKYLNSPETPLFKKNEILYGYHLARRIIREQNAVVLFEGYMDVIAAWMAGIENGVASLGTSLTDRQAQLIRRLTEHVTLCYDGDAAGKNAAISHAKVLSEKGCKVKIADLPAEMDPDDYIRTEGAAAFKEKIIGNAKSAVSFKINAYRKEKNMQREGDQQEYIEWVLKTLVDVASPVERERHLRELSEEFSLSMEALKQEQYRIYRSIRNKNRMYQTRDAEHKIKSRPAIFERELLPAFHNAERRLLQAMMEDAQWAEDVEQEVGGNFNVDEHAAISAYIYAYYAEGNPGGSAGFLNYLEDQALVRIAADIAMQEKGDMSPEAFDDYIVQVKNYPNWVEIERKEHELKEAERNQDMEAALRLGKEILTLKKALGRKIGARHLRLSR